MKLFTVGPVDMYEETLRIGGEPIPYFRTNEFSDIMFDVERKFLDLLDAPKGSKLITLTASGTGAMEASVLNLLCNDDKVLVIDGGSFGKRFSQICQLHNIPYTPLVLEFGETLTDDKLRKYDNQGYTALLVNIHETSIGQLYDYKMLGEFCKRNNMLYIVDAISSFLADELSMKAAGIDAVITASQKALALPPGLSFVALSPKALNERVSKLPVKCMYFDFKDYLINMERGQTPFTPAVGIVMQLKQRLDDIYSRGIDSEISHHRELAEAFRAMCDKHGISVVDFPKSNALTTIQFPKSNALEIFAVMKDKYGKMLTPSGGEIGKRVLRVGHLGNNTIEDYEELIKELMEVMA
ncbi:MAG: alanine--glyoxylate aminotransferase family protein [Lachnospiraceae bacterium]|nr:alanine--glyoxylate aminotransferase family protein [Lachnospiraceae bacterium]